jgi:hypothetical protein
MTDDLGDNPDEGPPYKFLDDLDFSLITMRSCDLPFFEDDLYLSMQAMNVGVVDSLITQQEFELLREYRELERTPGASAVAVSAQSQMWIYGLYELLRLWRDRRYQFEKLRQNGGIEPKIESMPAEDPINYTIEARKRQLLRFKDDSKYRELVESTWVALEPTYRMTELFRMNLAKHCAPGKDGIIPRAPGYGRINGWCGAIDFELIEKNGYYSILNRRDIADALRNAIQSLILPVASAAQQAVEADGRASS